MPLPIDDVLTDSLNYYLQLKQELVGRILINRKGSIVRKKIKGGVYFYNKKYQNGKVKYIYLDSGESGFIDRVRKEIEIRKSSIVELRKAKEALKKLGVGRKGIAMEDFSEVIKKVIAEFEASGLWEKGLELIGSWCFKVYQVHCDVEYFPFRTLDVDIAIPLHYEGAHVGIPALLRRLGFEERRNYADGSIYFKNADFMLEILTDRKGGRAPHDESHEKDLGVVPVAIPYLNILLENPMMLEGRDIGRVAVPSMPAFFLHKMLVADVRKDLAKKEKDYIQADAVAKRIASEEALLEQTMAIGGKLHAKWRKKIVSSADKMSDYHRNDSGAVGVVLTKMGWMLPGGDVAG